MDMIEKENLQNFKNGCLLKEMKDGVKRTGRKRILKENLDDKELEF
jgi:hypothetical protein